jgi:ADP-heptose:LPS heptosyltransferase
MPVFRVGIYRSSSIGDVVLATACIDLLSKLSVPVQITWLGRQPALGLLASAFPNVRCINVKRTDTLPELSEIANQLGDLHVLVDLQGNLRSKWLCMQVNRQFKVPVFSSGKAQFERSRLLIAARLRGRRKPLPVQALVPSKLQYVTMVDALRKAIHHHLPREVSENPGPCNPRLPVLERTVDKPWEKELKFGRWLAVAPGAAHETKRAPTELFMSILVEIKTRQKSDEPLGLVFLGDENDRKIALGICDKLSWSGPVLNLAGKLTLWETSLALRDCQMLLSNDSALAHIAEAVDTPVTVLFGPTIEGFGFGPRLASSRAFSVLLGCRPCSKHGKIPCRYNDKLCFATISHLDVATRILTFLGENGPTGGEFKASRLGRPEILPQSRET